MRKTKWNRTLTILVLMMFITVTYASFNTNLFIDGKAYVRVDRDIRITDIHLLETEYNGYENTNSEYTNRTISTDVSLPKQASSVTYEVTISNVSDRRYKITDIIEDSYDNRNVKYELIDASIGNIVEPHTTKTFRVKFTNNTTIVEEEDVYQTLTYTFDYTGGEQEFAVPYTGDYTIEVWGAQGGSADTEYVGGYGGYSTGKISLTNNQRLYINVGGAGTITNDGKTKTTGGYNGGGSGQASPSVNMYVGTGGGATHIATRPGVLSSLKNYKDTVLIVASGGGGSIKHSGGSNNQYIASGGSGGGIVGNDGQIDLISTNYTVPIVATGGTQTAGGERMYSISSGGSKTYSQVGSFGAGGGVVNARSTGGGSGWYGGASATRSGAAGGSGYIGNENLSDKSMYCFQCIESSETATKTISTENHSSTPTSNYAKEGNGYVKMTITRKIEDGSEYDFEYTGGQQTYTIPYSGTYQLETWGAQGGTINNTYYGGYGGYSKGLITLNKDQVIYINNGGQGICRMLTEDDKTASGGYNGGGQGSSGFADRMVCGGGGATHMATATGILSGLESNRNSILIVSGGGAGSWYYGDAASLSPGHGGGYKGTTGINGAGANCGTYSVSGGEQNSAGEIGISFGTFGQGGGIGYAGAAGGGGGYYGGNSICFAGGGGSGYIGNSLLKEKIMYGYNAEESQDINTRTVSTQSHSKNPKQNTAKEGNGYSRITLVKRTINQTKLTLDFTFEEYVNGNEFTFGYTGDYQTFTVPKTGYYKVELWGASGGSYDETLLGGYGGYSSGTIRLNKNEKLYVYVGSKGGENHEQTNLGGWNGGGASGSNSSGQSLGGGGSTDVRLVNGTQWSDIRSLSSRIIVAGGGGGAVYVPLQESRLYLGGKAGGLVSYGATDGDYPNNYITHGATQTQGGYIDSEERRSQREGRFGSAVQVNTSGWSGGGGGGYYGGTTGYGGAGSGGSSFISGHNGCVAITAESNTTPRNDSNGNQCSDGTTDIICSKHYSNYVFTDTKMIDGKGYEWTTQIGTEVVGMPTHDGTSTMTGNDGDGFAKITCLEEITDYSFDYTGEAQEFVAPYNGIYKIELWGAQGGTQNKIDNDKESHSGLGGYTSGNIKLSKNEKLNIYVGAHQNGIEAVFNGGALGETSGGGATDVRLVSGNWKDFNSLKTRIMVAAGGGGGIYYVGFNDKVSGDAGGLVGYNASATPTGASSMFSQEDLAYGFSGFGASQIKGGKVGGTDHARENVANYFSSVNQDYHYSYTSYGFFGKGGYGSTTQEGGSGSSSGGGGGYFGGGWGMHTGGSWPGGGGGSSYISGHSGCVSITENSTSENISFVNDSNGIACNDSASSGYNTLGYNTDSTCNKHYSGKVFTNTVMIDGKGYQWDENGKGDTVVGMPSPDGRTTIIGNVGDGFARITLVEKIDSYNINYELDGGTLTNERKTYSYYDDDITLKRPTKTGYTFTGWTGGNNLLEIKSTSKTYNGITFTVNADKSITMNGTATDNIFYYLNQDAASINGSSMLEENKITLKPKTTYYFNGQSFATGNNPGYLVEMMFQNNSGYGYPKGGFKTGATVGKAIAYIRVKQGTVIDNATIYPYLIEIDEAERVNYPNESNAEIKRDYETYNSTLQKDLVIPKRSSGHRTYKANWVKNYTTTFDGNGGTSYSVNVDDGDTSKYYPISLRDNKLFTGWYTQSTGGNYLDSYNFDYYNDRTVYAHWGEVSLPTEGNAIRIAQPAYATVSYDSDTKEYNFTQNVNQGEGTGTSGMASFKNYGPIPFGYRYFVSFEIKVDNEYYLTVDGNASCTNCTKGNDNYSNFRKIVNDRLYSQDFLLPANQWNHIVFCFDNSSDTINPDHADATDYTGFKYAYYGELSYKIRNIKYTVVPINN